MTQFWASLHNEGFKLWKRKKYLVFLIIGAVICAGSGLRTVLADWLTEGAVPHTALLGNFVGSLLPFVLMVFLPLMGIMATCDLFVGEQADHTIRFTLMRPVAKGKLYFSKAGAAFLLCAVDMGILYLVSGGTQLLLHGGSRGLLASLVSCLLDLIPLAILILFFSLVNQLAKGSGLAVLLCIVLYIGMLALGTYVPSVGGLLFTGYLRWHNLWVGTTLPFLSLLPRIGLLAGFGLVFATLGFLLFDRKEG